MSEVTAKVAQAVSESGRSIRQVAEQTHIPYMKLYDSLGNKARSRELRDWEILAVCKVIGVDPHCFYE